MEELLRENQIDKVRVSHICQQGRSPDIMRLMTRIRNLVGGDCLNFLAARDLFMESVGARRTPPEREIIAFTYNENALLSKKARDLLEGFFHELIRILDPKDPTGNMAMLLSVLNLKAVQRALQADMSEDDHQALLKDSSTRFETITTALQADQIPLKKDSSS